MVNHWDLIQYRIFRRKIEEVFAFYAQIMAEIPRMVLQEIAAVVGSTHWKTVFWDQLIKCPPQQKELEMKFHAFVQSSSNQCIGNNKGGLLT